MNASETTATDSQAPAATVANTPDTAPGANNSSPVDLDKLSPAELAGLLNQANVVRQAPAAPSAPKPAAKPAAPVANNDGDDDEDDGQPAATDDGRGKGHRAPQFRFRPSNDKDEAVFALVKSGKSVLEATRAVYGDELAAAKPTKTADVEAGTATKAKPAPAEATAKPTEPEADPVVAKLDTDLQAVDAEIVELRKKITAAKDDADYDALIDLQEALSDKKIAKARIEDRKASHAERAAEQSRIAAEQQAAVAEKADFDRLSSLYPQLTEKGSAERTGFEAFIQEKSDDPAFDGIFASPAWRTTLGALYAAENGIAPNGKAKAPPGVDPTPATTKNAGKPPAALPRSPAAKTVTTREAPASESFELTPELTLEQLGKLSAKELTAVLNEAESLGKTQRR